MKELEKQEVAKKDNSSDGPGSRSNSLWLVLSAVFAIGLGVFLFFFLPLAIYGLFNVDKNAVGFNLLAGGIRLTMFVLYVYLISLFGEFK
jgi:uncharacterized protein YqhQ